MVIDFYCEEIKIASVINGNVIFWPESETIVNKWGEKEIQQLCNKM